MPTEREFEKILDESMRLLEFWAKHDIELMDEKKSEVVDMMMTFPQIQRNFTRKDLRDRFGWIPSNLDKWVHSVSRISDLLSHPAVILSLTIRDESGYLPYLTLKEACSQQVKLIREGRLMTAKVNLEAFYQVIKQMRRPGSLIYAIT